jgi:hypothetical protein
MPFFQEGRRFTFRIPEGKNDVDLDRCAIKVCVEFLNDVVTELRDSDIGYSK